MHLSISGSNAIMCYHCNSAYDPRCADPFNSFSLGIINCSMAPVPDHVGSMGIERATLCRKTVQKGRFLKFRRLHNTILKLRCFYTRIVGSGALTLEF